MYDEIVSRYYNVILNYCKYKLNGNKTAAEDITQEVFFVLSGTESNDPLYMQSASCVYKNVSSRSFDDYSSYAAGGYVNISYGSIGEVKTIPSSNTSFVS